MHRSQRLSAHTKPDGCGVALEEGLKDFVWNFEHSEGTP